MIICIAHWAAWTFFFSNLSENFFLNQEFFGVSYERNPRGEHSGIVTSSFWWISLFCIDGHWPTKRKEINKYNKIVLILFLLTYRKKKQEYEESLKQGSKYSCSSNLYKTISFWAIHSVLWREVLDYSLYHPFNSCLFCLSRLRMLCISASGRNRKILYNIFHIIFDWNNRQNKAYRGRRWEWRKNRNEKKSQKENRNRCADNQTSQVKKKPLLLYFLVKDTAL